MNWTEYCLQLRRKIMRYNSDRRVNEYLLAGVKDTQQASDMSKHSSVLGYYFRVRKDVKDDCFDYDAVREKAGLYKKIDDMAYNAAYVMNGDVRDYNDAFVFQLAACNYCCPFCYVDDRNLNPRGKQVGWFSAKEIIEAFVEYRDKLPMNRIRISGGEPGLVPELWLEVLDQLAIKSISDRSLQKVFVYADTNLSGYYLTEFLMSDVNGRVLDRDVFKKIAEFHNFAVWGSIKGNDGDTFLESTGLPERHRGLALIWERMLEWLVSDGLDVYINVYNFEPQAMKLFLDKIFHKFGEKFLLRTWIQPIKIYSVVRDRLYQRGVVPDDYEKLLDDRLRENINIINRYLDERMGMSYRQMQRY